MLLEPDLVPISAFSPPPEIRGLFEALRVQHVQVNTETKHIFVYECADMSVFGLETFHQSADNSPVLVSNEFIPSPDSLGIPSGLKHAEIPTVLALLEGKGFSILARHALLPAVPVSQASYFLHRAVQLVESLHRVLTGSLAKNKEPVDKLLGVSEI